MRMPMRTGRLRHRRVFPARLVLIELRVAPRVLDSQLRVPVRVAEVHDRHQHAEYQRLQQRVRGQT